MLGKVPAIISIYVCVIRTSNKLHNGIAANDVDNPFAGNANRSWKRSASSSAAILVDVSHHCLADAASCRLGLAGTVATFLNTVESYESTNVS
jgi:hypothetical protein